MSLPFRQAVLALIINDQQQFLIGSSPRDGGYKFPQGGLDPEEHPFDGVLRELKEELGLQFSKEDLLFQLDETVKYAYPDYKPYSKIYCGQEMYVFAFRWNNSMPFPIAQDEEFDIFYWVNEQDLLNYDFLYRKPAYFSAVKQALSKMENRI